MQMPLVAMVRMTLALTIVSPSACSGSDAGRPVSTPDTFQQPLVFSFSSSDGQKLDSEELKGRVTLILLIATFDMASQLSVRQANELLHTVKPRINVGAVVMEAPQYAELKGTFQETFDLHFPVVMADHATLGGRGPFGDIVHIPTLIVLDRTGRERARLRGPVSEDTLKEAISAAR